MMAQFGQLDGVDILGSDLRDLLHTELARNHPSMTGVGLIFGLFDYNDQHVVYHAGNGPGFDSFMALFPEQNIGLFIATIGQPPAPGPFESLSGSERLIPDEDLNVRPWLGAQEAFGAFMLDVFGPAEYEQVETADLERYEGVFWGERRFHTTWEAILGLAMNYPYSVEAVEGGLMINSVGPYISIGDDTFQREDDEIGVRRKSFSFNGESAAQILHAYPGLDVAPRVDGIHPRLLLPPFLIGMILLASGLFSVFYPNRSTDEIGLSRLKWLPPVMLLTFILGLLAVISGHPPEEDFFFGIGRSYQHPWRFTLFLLATNAIAIGTLVLIWTNFRAWQHQYWAEGWVGVLLRGHFALVTAGWIAVLPLLSLLNLIGWNWP